MSGISEVKLRNSEIKTWHRVGHIQWFPKMPQHADQSLRLGICLATYQLSFNMAIPIILRLAFFSKKREKTKVKSLVSKKGSQHVRQIGFRKNFRLGIDTYLGEFGLVLPLFKLWLKFEPFGKPFWERGMFSFFFFLIKCSAFELMFQVRILGLGLSFHIPLYEWRVIGQLRDKRNRSFWENYKAQKKPLKHSEA